jgi:hypothetical protein
MVDEEVLAYEDCCMLGKAMWRQSSLHQIGKITFGEEVSNTSLVIELFLPFPAVCYLSIVSIYINIYIASSIIDFKICPITYLKSYAAVIICTRLQWLICPFMCFSHSLTAILSCYLSTPHGDIPLFLLFSFSALFLLRIILQLFTSKR